MSVAQLELFDTAPTRWQTWLASTLGAANSNPHWRYRERFYRMKDKILRQYGMADGDDYQEIIHYCNSCDGTGGLYEPGGCYKCCGDGVYRRVYIRLERWRIGGRVFHRPAERLDYRPSEISIKGKVIHKPAEHAKRAAVVLAALFDPGLCYLLLADRHWIWKVRGWRMAVGNAWRRINRRCGYCGRRMWPFRRFDSFHCSAYCRDKRDEFWQEDLPF